MSAPFTVQDVVRWTHGVVLAGAPEAQIAGVSEARFAGMSEARFTGTSIDTRTVAPGALFIAIVGEKHDAHAFLEKAIAAGAAGLLVERDHPALCTLAAEGIVLIGVDDTTQALADLAAGHRALFEGIVVAITGSNGKTTTKEMCAAILSQRANCLKNEGNLNNQFGLPLTLLRREPSHQVAVVELGMNHRGEIAALTAIAKPDVAVITNVGTAHIEFLGTQDEIATEKGDLIADLPPEATAVLNADDSRVAAQAERTRARVLRFGRTADADVRALNVAAGEDGSLWFEISCAQGAREVAVAGLGEATLSNALAASAAALAAGASLDDVVAGLRRYQPVAGRLTRIDLPGDVVVIDDTYNANPQSMENALRTLADLPRARHIAVLGAMGELGKTASDAHVALGRLAAQLELHTVFAVGKGAAGIAAGALEKGMPPSSVFASDSCAEASAKLIEMLAAGDGVLVKGSRSARMERVVEALIEHQKQDGNL